MNVLVVAAHPDDEILGCGGTINRLRKEGNEVDILIFSTGRDDPIDQKMDTIPLVDIISRIELAVEEAEAEIVFTHHINDLNRDHQIVSEATRVACRPQSGVKELYSYITISSSNNNVGVIQPDTYMILDEEDVKYKKDAMKKLYAHELMKYPHARSLESIDAHARYFGVQVGSEYAECFNLIRREL